MAAINSTIWNNKAAVSLLIITVFITPIDTLLVIFEIILTVVKQEENMEKYRKNTDGNK